MTNLVPSWVCQRLENLALERDDRGPHFEASYYRPINKMADFLFSEEYFIVKPQPTIRPMLNVDWEVYPEEEQPLAAGGRRPFMGLVLDPG